MVYYIYRYPLGFDDASYVVNMCVCGCFCDAMRRDVAAMSMSASVSVSVIGQIQSTIPISETMDCYVRTRTEYI